MDRKSCGKASGAGSERIRKSGSARSGAFNCPALAPAAVKLPVKAFLREPANDMPAYSTALLSDKEAADMWAWLHSLPGRKSAKDFPLLNQ